MKKLKIELNIRDFVKICCEHVMSCKLKEGQNPHINRI